MRLSEDLLLQLVESDPPKLVLMDGSIGAEVTWPLTLETTVHLIDDVAVARTENRPLVVDGISVPVESFDTFLSGLGYFAGQVLT